MFQPATLPRQGSHLLVQSEAVEDLRQRPVEAADQAGAPVGCRGLLVLACLLAPLSQSTGVLAVALFTLGLGWNFCYVAGGALLTDSLTLAERSRMQGGADLTVGLISALGSLQSGALFAWLGFARLSWISLLVALVPFALVVYFWRALVRRRPVPEAQNV